MTRTSHTAAQAIVRFLTQQKIEINGEKTPLCAGGFAIFGHGNVAGLGEALYQSRDALPLWRAHNEQSMGHAAIAYAKSLNRKRFMFCASSIGPGATNMVTAAALAHVNRLPVLFLPGDVFASRHPDPVLQQVESWQDGTQSANDCFRPVSRYFDRITRPEQLLDALPKAIHTMLDPAHCGPVTLAMPQDVQAYSYDYPNYFFEEQLHRVERIGADNINVQQLAQMIRRSAKPMVIVGGGVLYSEATEQLISFLDSTGIPAGETQAGKSALPWNHPSNMGSIGVTGTTSANNTAREADLIIGLGSRLQDFTSGSRTLFSKAQLVQVNVSSHDSNKHYSFSVTADVGRLLQELQPAVAGWHVSKQWQEYNQQQQQEWLEISSKVTTVTEPRTAKLTDAQVIGIMNASGKDDDIVVCAAGSLPGELHKHWRASRPNGYHAEYGFSCMGYEIAGGMGVRMAHPDREVIVMVGDGSYLMLNAELHASVMQGIKIIVIVLDNHGFGCINRLQQGTGNAPFNNLWRDSQHLAIEQDIDFTAHAQSMGCNAERVEEAAELLEAMKRARASDRTYLIEIKTDAEPSTAEGGCWWEVAIPEVSAREGMSSIFHDYQDHKNKEQKI